ncbi:uncharacterized protein LOC111685038 isoform X2 [Lucilia cuprina]|uniref:uncharacterized protein LOC111685038 isoform X2 n=1 Tax=Lucilia cuprina TaxID=7375 RepID=UPI001F05A591|nr:uncharacterized protein LOC111685038 isoform X2 [Lucilia cuprina]
MLKFLITFSAGIYTGIYISQNYEVPRVDEPGKIIDKIKELADEHRKNLTDFVKEISNNRKEK